MDDFRWCIFRYSKYLLNDTKIVYNGIDLSILLPKHKGEPALLNYALIRIPKGKVFNRPFLRGLRKKSKYIDSWLMSTEPLNPTSKRERKRIDGEEFDNFSKVANLTSIELAQFLEGLKDLRLKDPIFKPGDTIRLLTGPFKTLLARISTINGTILKVFLVKDNKEVLLPIDINLESTRCELAY